MSGVKHPKVLGTNLVCDGGKDERTHGQADVMVEIVIDVGLDITVHKNMSA